MRDLYSTIILIAVLLLWGTVGALECNTISMGTFWIQTALFSSVIWFCARKLRKNK